MEHTIAFVIGFLIGLFVLYVFKITINISKNSNIHTINGKTYTGNKISVSNGVVTVDGVVVEENNNSTTFIVKGDLASLVCDWSVSVNGNVHTITGANTISCDDVEGNIECKGSVNCDDVGGNITAGGSVNCDSVRGNVSAKGSINRG